MAIFTLRTYENDSRFRGGSGDLRHLYPKPSFSRYHAGRLAWTRDWKWTASGLSEADYVTWRHPACAEYAVPAGPSAAVVTQNLLRTRHRSRH